MKNILSIILAVSFGFTPVGYAQERTTATPENEYANPTVSAAATTTTTTIPTIQSSGDQSSKKNNAGKLLGMAAMGVTAAGVAMTCFTPVKNPKCPWFIAGLAASTIVTTMMGKAKKQSDATVSAVTVGAAPVDSTANPADQVYNGSGTDYSANPDYQAGLQAIDALKKQGYAFDMKTGVVTDPSGKKFSADTFASNASMAAAGYSSGQIAGFNAERSKLLKDIEAKVKAADGTDMFGEEAGGGGGAKAAASAGAADGGLGGVSLGSAGLANQGLGIDRDPAQVAGMTKSLGGEPIGVSADSIFGMMGRRYDFLEGQNSFMTGP